MAKQSGNNIDTSNISQDVDFQQAPLTTKDKLQNYRTNPYQYIIDRENSKLDERLQAGVITPEERQKQQYIPEQDKQDGVITNLLKGLVRFLVMPASNSLIYNLIKLFKGTTLRDKSHVEESFELKHADGTIVDGVRHIDAQNVDLPPEQQKWVVYCPGNTQPFETRISERYFDSYGHMDGKIPQENAPAGLRHNYIAFNYRGVGKSTLKGPLTYHSMVEDTIAQVLNLIDDGVDPMNITIKGHSIGGATDVKASAILKEFGLKVKVFDGRSFADITDIPKPGIMRRLAKTYFPKAGWNFRVTEDWASLDHDCKEFVKVVPTDKDKQEMWFPRRDEVIPESAMLPDDGNQQHIIRPDQMTLVNRIIPGLSGLRMHDKNLQDLHTEAQKEGGVPITAHDVFVNLCTKDVHPTSGTHVDNLTSRRNNNPGIQI